MKHQSKAKFTTASQFRATLFNSWINLLYFIVPTGFAVRYTSGNSLATFLVNFFAIIPLPSAAEYAIAELTLYVGEIGVDWSISQSGTRGIRARRFTDQEIC